MNHSAVVSWLLRAPQRPWLTCACPRCPACAASPVPPQVDALASGTDVTMALLPSPRPATAFQASAKPAGGVSSFAAAAAATSAKHGRHGGFVVGAGVGGSSDDSSDDEASDDLESPTMPPSK